MFLLLCCAPLAAKPKIFPPAIYMFEGYPDLPRCEVAFINGMNHRPQRACKCAGVLVGITEGYNVYTVYNPTDGVFGDLKKGYHELFHLKATPPVFQLHDKWNAFFANSDERELFLQFCHSQGAIQVRNALIRYPHELRKRIVVVAIAPAAYIPDAICHHALHYVSRRDIVHHLDYVGKKLCKESTVTLTPHPEAAFFDHHFLSPTYRPAIEHHLKEFLKKEVFLDD